MMQAPISRMAMAPLMRDYPEMADAPITTLAANLTIEMDRLGYNDYSLAMAAGLKADVVRDIKRGRTKQPAASRLDAIARVLGRTSGQLLGHEPMPQAPEPAGAEQARNLIHDPAELALITLWRTLDKDERKTLLADILRSRLEDR